MTKAEMDARKIKIIRFLLKEDLPIERLELFEITRDHIENYRQERQNEEEEPSSRLSEPEIKYHSHHTQSVNTRITELARYLLDDATENEDTLLDFELLCNDIKPPCMFTVEELRKRADKAEAEFERGEGIPHEEARRMIEAWR